MQNDFIDGAGTKEAEAIVGRVVEIIGYEGIVFYKGYP